LKAYRAISRLSIAQATLAVISSVTFGSLGFISHGQLLTQIGVAAVTATVLVYNSDVNLKDFPWKISGKKLAIMKRFKSFPLMNATTSLLDGATVYAPIFILGRYYPESVVGSFALMNRVINAPLSVVSQSLAPVYTREVAERLRTKNGAEHFVTRVAVLLLAISIIPCLALVLFGEQLFAMIFGPPWLQAGVYASILAPSIFLKFIVSNLSTVFASTGHNSLAAFWKITAFVTTLGVLPLATRDVNPTSFFFSLGMLDIGLYTLYIGLIRRALRTAKQSPA
jgi:O-antigen/teichoic acid export membrane protein